MPDTDIAEIGSSIAPALPPVFGVPLAIGASIYSSYDASKSAKRAANIQAQAAGAGIAEQRRQFDIGIEKLEPFREAELAAMRERQALTGLMGTQAQQEAIGRISAGPGVDFARKRAQQALVRQASATGGLGGARLREALQEQETGFAQQDLQEQLQSLRGIGQGATTQQVQLGRSLASNVAAGLEQAGAARASGILGAREARARGERDIAEAIGYGLEQGEGERDIAEIIGYFV